MVHVEGSATGSSKAPRAGITHAPAVSAVRLSRSEMSLPPSADASALQDRVAALAARVEELETEAEADRALYLRIGMGHTDPELKAKPESEVFGALEESEAVGEEEARAVSRHDIAGISGIRVAFFSIQDDSVRC